MRAKRLFRFGCLPQRRGDWSTLFSSPTCTTWLPQCCFYGDSFIYLSLIRHIHAYRQDAPGACPRPDPPSGWRPPRPANHREALGPLVQSERGGHAVGGSRAAPKRDIEIVEERRLVGNECHSLRVLIIWRGVCSARPVRLPGGTPGGAETKLNWDDCWTRFRTGEIPSRLPVGPHDRLSSKIDRMWARGGRRGGGDRAICKWLPLP